jgi:hypothetical protein
MAVFGAKDAPSASIPKTPHVADPTLAPFLQESFDPAAYLNSALPNFSSNARSSSSLADVSAETQTLLASLNAHASRLTNTLTQLTDDVLRSGGRLAYQVDVLRGETIGLADTLGEGLKDDIEVFVPLEKLVIDAESPPEEEQTAEPPAEARKQNEPEFSQNSNEPSFVSQLQLLTFVRERLDSVIQLFGSAMAWPSPPSETSSFISVSAPPSGEAEIKAKQHAERLRNELADLVVANDEAAALAKIEEFKGLLGVWKGTAEERGREKFVAELTKLVEDKVKERESLASPRKGVRGRAESRGQDFVHGFYG